jgi:pyruvate/2-oxoglutarate/acetoin dehydrogenase E1 component
LKETIIDAEKLSSRKIALFRKEMRLSYKIEDEVEQAEKQAEILASVTENWTKDEILDLPIKDTMALGEAIGTAFEGIVPNEKRPS